MRIFSTLIIFIILSTTSVFAQINTPAGATMPFGANTGYANGILPTNLPTGGAYGKSQDAADAYNEWKGFYVDQTCAGGTQARVKFDDINKTVSEGIAYGMLLSAYAADKALFDKFWAYYKANMNGNGIMNWSINGCSGVNGANGATDADLDAAMALIIAENQWPAINAPYDYSTEANTLLSKIKQFEMTSGTYQAINGDGWGFGNTCRNPSYQSPGYYPAYASQVPADATFWNNAVTGAYTLLNANAHATTGLVSDWSDNNGNKNQCNGGYDGYGFDACRNPWRMATDVIWWNSTNGANHCTKLASYINSQGATNVKGPRNLDGTGGGYHSATFVSTYATALVGTSATYQTLLNQMYTETKNTKDALQTGYPSGYFGNTLRCLSLFVMTGNFWKPGSQASQEIDVNVASVSIASGGTYDFQNVQNASNKSVTFTIENKGSVALSLSGSPIVNVTSGATFYTVTTQPGSTSLNGGATTTFIVRFTPGSNGVKNGTISIANNDANENPYVINLIGTGTTGATSPEIVARQSGTNINTGGTSNIGSVTQNATTYVTYTIDNTGTGPLNITSTVVSAGQGYSLNVAPPASIAAGGSATFSIKFNPTTTGTKTGTITIANDDPDEGSFVINLTSLVTTCATSITNTSVLQDFDANNNITQPFAPTGAYNAAFANPFPGAANPSATVAQYNRLGTGTYDVIRYSACGANFSFSASKPMISFLVYSPVSGKNIILSCKNSTGTAVLDVTKPITKANQWERIYFDYSSIIGNTTVTQFDIMIDPTPDPGIARTYYLDDIRYDSNPCLTDLPTSGIFNDYDNHRNVSLAFNPVGAINEVFANPSVSGINTSATVTQYVRGATGNYDVIRYNGCGTNIDFSGKTVVSFQIYSPVAGVPVTLSMKNAANAAVLDVQTKTTKTNTWETLYFDYGTIAGNTTVTKFDIMIDPLNTVGTSTTYYFDAIQYDVNPCFTGIAATGVMQDYNNNRFLTMTNANAAFNDLTANPSATGVNTSTTVGRLNRPATGYYNLIRYASCGNNFDLSPGKTVYAMDVYSPVANARVVMLLKKSNGTTTLIADSALVTAANTWQTLTFDFSAALADNTGAFLDIYLDPNIVQGAQTYYIDNIRFAPPAPEINVKQGATNILSGGSFDMGTVTAGGSSSALTFTIQNNGTGDLTLSGSPKVAISGANQADFVINQSTVVTTLGAVTSTSFTVTFSPAAAGAKSAMLTILNNDANEGTYTINLTGTASAAAAPEINVKQGATNYLTSSTYSFSSVAAGSSSSAITFTIQNTGTAALTISSLLLGGTDVADFSLNQTSTASSVAASGSTTYTITFSPTTSGSKSASVVITNNDSDEGTYTINLSGTATSGPVPEINVKQGATNYLTGSTYAFGSKTTGTSTSAITFTIQNTGTASLSLTSLTLIGTDASEFSLNQTTTASSVAASGTTTYAITFSPTTAGGKSASIVIANNDSDEGSYTINLSGTGVAATAINDQLLSNTIIAPNPVTDIVTVSVGNALDGLFDFRVKNSFGVVVQEVKAVRDVELSLGTLPSGIYYIEITQGDHKAYKKIVKQ